MMTKTDEKKFKIRGNITYIRNQVLNKVKLNSDYKQKLFFMLELLDDLAIRTESLTYLNYLLKDARKIRDEIQEIDKDSQSSF